MSVFKDIIKRSCTDEKKTEDTVDRYYQPYYNEGDDQSMPDELNSFDVFKKKEDCIFWLDKNGYDSSQYEIVEFCGDDIEDPVILDKNGYVI